MSPVALLAVKGEEPASALGTLAYMIGVRLMEVLHDKPSAPMNLFQCESNREDTKKTRSPQI